MKKELTRDEKEYYYYKDGKKVIGAPTDVWGDLSGVRGDLSGVRGNLDDCDITDEDRKKGIDIKDLIK